MEPSPLPQPPAAEPGAPEPALRRRSFAASALLHAAILAALLGLWRSTPLPEEPLIAVRVVTDGPGAAGASGGAAGGGEAPATTQAAAQAEAAPSDATSTAPPEESAAPPEETSAAPPEESAAPPEETSAAPPAPERATPAPPHPRRKPPAPHAAAKASPAPAEPPLEAQVAAAPLPQPQPGRPGAGGPAMGLGAGQGAKGAGEGAVGDGPVGSPGDDYLERVRRWIQLFQHYPEEATQRKQEGTAVLGVTLARDGRVLKVELERSSGYPLLDQAAIKAVYDASPVPPFPPTYRRDEGTMVLPARYSLGFFERLF